LVMFGKNLYQNKVLTTVTFLTKKSEEMLHWLRIERKACVVNTCFQELWQVAPHSQWVISLFSVLCIDNYAEVSEDTWLLLLSSRQRTELAPGMRRVASVQTTPI
jgi:hypothetical protein